MKLLETPKSSKEDNMLEQFDLLELFLQIRQ